MGEDASLEDFVDAGSSDADESVDDEPSDDPSGTDRSDEIDDASVGESGVDPATATYRVTVSPEPCPACGDHVRRFWDDDDAFVCPNCKAW